MVVSPVCWSSVAEVEDFPPIMADYTRVMAPGGAATMAARSQPALACVVFIGWSVDLVVNLFTFEVLCTISEFLI